MHRPALMLLFSLLACSRGEHRPAAAERAVEPAASGPVPDALPAAGQPPSAALHERMAAFTRALRDSDTTAFLAAFSRTRPWTVYGTHDAIPIQRSMRYADLVRAFDTKNRTHARLFGERPSSLRTFTTPDLPWTALNSVQFAPPAVKRGVAWVAWRLEDAAWVVDTLAWPVE